MRALLFSMPDIYPSWEPFVIRMPNLALASIAGNSPNHEVFAADLILKRKNVKKAIRSAIKKTNPDIIGLSAMTFQFPTLVKVAEFIKDLRPDLPIAIGGYHATVLYKDIPNEPYAKHFDYIFRGESDLSFNELLDQLESNKSPSKVKGLSYKKGKRFVHNPKRPLENINDIKLPKRDSRIWKGFHLYKRPLDTIETSRGCLKACKFCSIRQMYGHSRREYPISRVIQDIKNARDLGSKYFFFTDDNITGDIAAIKRFDKLLDAIIKNGLNDSYYMTQVSSLGMGYKESIVKKMRKAGFDAVFLGMENMSERNLKYLRKGNIVNYTRKALKYLHDNGIGIMGGLILGNEFDTEEDFKINYEQLIKSEVDQVLDQVLTPYPGTEIRGELMKKGMVTNPKDWGTYSGFFANIKTNNMSAMELNFFKWKYGQPYFKWREKNFYKLNLVKNHFHPKFVLSYFYNGILKSIPRRIKLRGKSEEERFKMYFDKVLNLNKDLL
jgi:radical SAM superfamily enzyme YgiQ (UPF0313 family)